MPFLLIGASDHSKNINILMFGTPNTITGTPSDVAVTSKS